MLGVWAWKQFALSLLADDVIREMTAAQVLQKQLFDAHEPNLLDENGKLHLLNHIFQLLSLISILYFSSTTGWMYLVEQVDILVLPASASYHMCFFISLRFHCLMCLFYLQCTLLWLLCICDTCFCYIR